jgi:RND family efflux transporter MFP subunit
MSNLEDRIVRDILRIIIPFIILGAGGFIAYYLYLSRLAPLREVVTETEIPVHVIEAKRGDFDLVIEGNGEVMPAKQIVINTQVSGKITNIHPSLIPGGVFKEGDTLIKIDERDYQYTIDQLKEQVEKSKMMLDEEVGRKTVAQREWKLLGNEVATTEEGKSLALREPHIRSAQAAVNAAESKLENAKLDLDRTTIKAPFNCWVLHETVDIGQVVNPQNQVATLVGTDEYWVDAKINSSDLPYIFVPTTNDDEGSDVTIVYDAEPLEFNYKGKIIRLLGDMSTSGRQVRVLIKVEDPLGLNRLGTEENYPLFLGTYVNTRIQGKTIKNVFSIPRAAIREGNHVWVRNKEGRLDIKQVTILKKRKDDVLVSEGIDEGDEVVTSLLATPLPGVKLILTEPENEDRGTVESPDSVVSTN